LSPPEADVSQSCGEGNEQNRSNGAVGETCTHHQAVLKSVVHQKQVIADSSGQAATVWGLGGQPAKDSGKEYGRLFKEIMGALTRAPRNGNPSDSALEACIFGTKEAALPPTPPFVVSPPAPAAFQPVPESICP